MYKIKQKVFSLCLLISFFIINNAMAINYEIGPSPRSADYHKVFNTQNYYKLNRLRKKTQFFRIHPMSIYSRAAGSNKNYAHNVSFTTSEIKKASKALNKYNFKTTVAISAGLTHPTTCNSNSSVNSAAYHAAKHEIDALKKLTKQGIKIERIYVDGPFLRLLKYAKKSFSCGLGQNSLKKGHHSMSKTAQIVNLYLNTIHKSFPKAKIFLLLNIVNWQQDSIAPHYGTNKYQLNTQLAHFFNIYKKYAKYTLGGFQFDSPWGVIKAQGISKFHSRISQLLHRIKLSLGSRALSKFIFSVLVNSEPKEGHYFGMLPHNFNPKNKYSTPISDKNVCIKSIQKKTLRTKYRTCLLNDYYFYKDSINFANSIRGWKNSSTPFKYLNLEISFTSWHAAPKYSVDSPGSYIDFVINYRDGRNGRTLTNVIKRNGL